MTDPIDRQDAIDAMTTTLWHYPTECLRRNINEYGFVKGLAELALKSVPPAQPEPHWIPVSERLPDKYGWYICSLKDERVNSLYWDNRRAIWVDNVRKYMFDLYTIRSKLTNKEIGMEQEAVYWDGWVTAWMSLPAPYREEGD